MRDVVRCIGTRVRSWTNGSRHGRDSPALFLTRTGRKLSRREYGAICRVAAQANAHLPEDEKIDVSPTYCGIRFCGSSPKEGCALCP